MHGAGSSTVPWTTNNTFKGTTSNAAFHVNANDGVPGPRTTGTNRWERLVGPVFAVPANAEYVTVDMDLAYDTEDDPNFNIQAFDGLFLRITDQTGLPRQAFSALAEAFQEEMTTGVLQHYNKHLPRNGASGYFPNGDMSCWAGDSQGFQHVRLKFPGAGGLAGGIAQLRFEFTQDGSAICSDVRPGHTCGVMVDNIVVRSVVSVQPTSLAVDPAAGQYSDVVTLKATVSPATSGTDTAAGTVEFFVDQGLSGHGVPDCFGRGHPLLHDSQSGRQLLHRRQFHQLQQRLPEQQRIEHPDGNQGRCGGDPSALNPVTVRSARPAERARSRFRRRSAKCRTAAWATSHWPRR